MKNLFLIVFCIMGSMTRLDSQDLPHPPSNIVTLPAYSYIIAMDNTNQVAANGYFNIKSYGLIVYLLNNNVRVKWVITAGKIKDAVDFTVNSDKIRPVISTAVTSRSFKGGPFVIFASDTTGVSALVDAFNASNGLTGNDRPNIYRNTTAVNVDVRYDLTAFKPHAGILNDGTNDTIHLHYMQAAAIPLANYNLTNGTDLISGCYTFASEPHNTRTGPVVDSAISSIRHFVLSGGNFLAQCAADSNYENNPLGRFQTTSGMNVANANIGNLLYPNADLSFSQFEGAFLGYDGNSFVQNWTIKGSAINNENNHTTGSKNSFTANINASEAKLVSGIGGLVFYIGIHSFTNDSLRSFYPVQMMNGLRMYMNAFLTPAQLVCGVLPVRFIDLSYTSVHEGTSLQWSVANNETASFFEVEKSTDGIHFTLFGKTAASDVQGIANYQFVDQSNGTVKAYYRIRLVNKQNVSSYSSILAVNRNAVFTNGRLSLLGNPIQNTLRFTFNSEKDQQVIIQVYSSLGGQIYNLRNYVHEGVNNISQEITLAKGVYYLIIDSGDKQYRVPFIKQ